MSVYAHREECLATNFHQENETLEFLSPLQMFLIYESAGKNSALPSYTVRGKEGNSRQCSSDIFALETLALPSSSLYSLPGVSLHCRAI